MPTSDQINAAVRQWQLSGDDESFNFIYRAVEGIRVRALDKWGFLGESEARSAVDAAVWNACKTWRPEKSQFVYFLPIVISGRLRAAYRRSKQKGRQVLSTALPLDEPVYCADDDDLKFMDLLEDPNAAMPFAGLEAEDLTQERRAQLQAVLKQLNPNEARILGAFIVVVQKEGSFAGGNKAIQVYKQVAAWAGVPYKTVDNEIQKIRLRLTGKVQPPRYSKLRERKERKARPSGERSLMATVLEAIYRTGYLEGLASRKDVASSVGLTLYQVNSAIDCLRKRGALPNKKMLLGKSERVVYAAACKLQFGKPYSTANYNDLQRVTGLNRQACYYEMQQLRIKFPGRFPNAKRVKRSVDPKSADQGVATPPPGSPAPY